MVGVTALALLSLSPTDLVRTALSLLRLRMQRLALWLRHNRRAIAGSAFAVALALFAWLRRLRARFRRFVNERHVVAAARHTIPVALPPASGLRDAEASMRRPQVVVLGGGVAGLAAAWRVADAAPGADV